MLRGKIPHLTAFVTLPGLNGGASSIWDFVSGSFSPTPSPVFSSLASTTGSGDLARLFRDLDEAKKKLKQWEEVWLQVKQVSGFSKRWCFNSRFMDWFAFVGV